MDEFHKAIIATGGSVGERCRFSVDEFHLGKGITIEDDVTIKCKSLTMGDEIKIERGADITITKELSLGKQSIIGPNFRLYGRSVTIGRELWSGTNVTIGGGSCFEVHSKLTMGYWCHLGDYSFVNTAREVVVGNEVGMGVRTCIFTHGAYQSYLDGFPVQFAPVRIGNRCWLPNAIVNPGVTIGENTVVAAGSIVTKDLPSGCLVAGMPAKILRENAFPQHASNEEARKKIFEILIIFHAFLSEKDNRFTLNARDHCIVGPSTYIGFNMNEQKGRSIIFGLDDLVPPTGDTHTIFYPNNHNVVGAADGMTERLRNLLRRYGIRFKVDIEDGHYIPWREEI